MKLEGKLHRASLHGEVGWGGVGLGEVGGVGWGWVGLGGEVRTVSAEPPADTGNGEPLTNAGTFSTWQ